MLYILYNTLEFSRGIHIFFIIYLVLIWSPLKEMSAHTLCPHVFALGSIGIIVDYLSSFKSYLYNALLDFKTG